MTTSSADHVASSADPLDTRAASRDLWPGGTLLRWQGEVAPRPSRVFWPESDDEVAAVLTAASAAGVAIVPYGAGSGVCGGARGRAGAWVVDTKRMDAIGPVDLDTFTVEAGAGVNGQHLEDALQAAGFTLGHSPSSIMCSTVGGWAAARSAGQFSSRYGVFEDMVLGLDGVAPGTGPFCVGLPGAQSPSERLPDDMLPMLLGSEGTLAVITRVRMRVRPVPRERWLRGYRFADVPSALHAMRTLMQGELWPSVVRLYDPVDTFVGGKTKPKSAHREEGPAWWMRWLEAVDALPEVRRRTLTLPLSLPGFLQRIAEHLASGCLLIVGWEGEPDVVAAASKAGHAILDDLGEDLGPEPGQRWFASRHAISYKLMPVFERGGFADTMEIAARWSVLPRVYQAVREAVGPTALVMAHMSHVYPEGGCIYFSFAGQGDTEVYRRTWQAAQAAVLASGATVTHHHGVGSLKAPWATQEVGPAVEGWTHTRQRLDPAGILNPERLFLPDQPVTTPPPTVLAAEDGLAFVTPADLPSLADRSLWGWSSLPGPQPWEREAWQTSWQEVRGDVKGVPCALGRGPRSAAGPDLRRWLLKHGSNVLAAVAVASEGPRWMGSARVEAPWRVAQQILRADLRPAVLGVRDGVLYVGFRGPAAEAFGALADQVVSEGLTPCAWSPLPRAAGGLEPCDIDRADVVHVTTEHAFRRRGGARV